MATPNAIESLMRTCKTALRRAALHKDKGETLEQLDSLQAFESAMKAIADHPAAAAHRDDVELKSLKAELARVQRQLTGEPASSSHAAYGHSGAHGHYDAMSESGGSGSAAARRMSRARAGEGASESGESPRARGGLAPSIGDPGLDLGGSGVGERARARAARLAAQRSTSPTASERSGAGRSTTGGGGGYIAEVASVRPPALRSQSVATVAFHPSTMSSGGGGHHDPSGAAPETAAIRRALDAAVAEAETCRHRAGELAARLAHAESARDDALRAAASAAASSAGGRMGREAVDDLAADFARQVASLRAESARASAAKDADLEALQSDLARCQSEVAVQSAARESAAKQLRESNARRESMVSATADLQEKVARAKLETQEGILRATEEIHRAANARISDMEEQMRAAEGRAEDAARTATARADALHQKLATAQAEAAAQRQAAIKAKLASEEALQFKVEDAQRKIAALEAAAVTTQAQHRQEVASEKALLAEKIAALSAKHAAATEAADRRAVDLQSRVDAAHRDLADAAASAERAAERATETDAELRRLRSRVADCEADLEEAAGERAATGAAWAQTQADLESQIETLRTDVDRATVAAAALAARLEATEASAATAADAAADAAAEADRRLEDAAAAASALRSDLESTRAALDEAEADGREATALLGRRGAEVDALKREAEEEEAAHGEEMKEAEARQVALRGELAALGETLASSRRAAESAAFDAASRLEAEVMCRERLESDWAAEREARRRAKLIKVRVAGTAVPGGGGGHAPWADDGPSGGSPRLRWRLGQLQLGVTELHGRSGGRDDDVDVRYAGSGDVLGASPPPSRGGSPTKRQVGGDRGGEGDTGLPAPAADGVREVVLVAMDSTAFEARVRGELERLSATWQRAWDAGLAAAAPAVAEAEAKARVAEARHAADWAQVHDWCARTAEGGLALARESSHLRTALEAEAADRATLAVAVADVRATAEGAASQHAGLQSTVETLRGAVDALVLRAADSTAALEATAHRLGAQSSRLGDELRLALRSEVAGAVAGELGPELRAELASAVATEADARRAAGERLAGTLVGTTGPLHAQLAELATIGRAQQRRLAALEAAVGGGGLSTGDGWADLDGLSTPGPSTPGGVFLAPGPSGGSFSLGARLSALERWLADRNDYGSADAVAVEYRLAKALDAGVAALRLEMDRRLVAGTPGWGGGGSPGGGGGVAAAEAASAVAQCTAALVGVRAAMVDVAARAGATDAQVADLKAVLMAPPPLGGDESAAGAAIGAALRLAGGAAAAAAGAERRVVALEGRLSDLRTAVAAAAVRAEGAVGGAAIVERRVDALAASVGTDVQALLRKVDRATAAAADAGDAAQTADAKAGALAGEMVRLHRAAGYLDSLSSDVASFGDHLLGRRDGSPGRRAKPRKVTGGMRGGY